MDPTLAERTIGAVQWRIAASVLQGLLQLGIGVLLARLLPPEDFGVAALAMVMVGLAVMLTEMGLGPTLVQRSVLTDLHLRAAFTASLLLGLGLAVVTFAAAPLAATLLRLPLLEPVLRVETLLFIFTSVGVTSRALLQRQLGFRRLFYIDLASYGFGYAVVAVVMALQGFGVWSLVCGAVLQSALASALALGVVRPPMRIFFSRVHMGALVGFSVAATLNQLANYGARNGDRAIVGRILGASALGVYTRAFLLMDFPLSFVANASSVLFSAFSRLQGDTQRLGRAYLYGVQFTALLAAPIMAGVMIGAPHVVIGLYGPRWAQAILPLQILAGIGLFRSLFNLAGALTYASDRVYSEMRRQAVYAGTVIVGSVIGSNWGLPGVAAGVAVANFGMYLSMAHLSLGIVRRTWREFAGAHVPGLVLALVTTGIALPVRLALERQGVGSLWIFLAIAVSCAVAIPVGLYLLPTTSRPTELFERFGLATAGLPAPLRVPLHRVLRIEA
jgi:PST family polysaccharide transporter